MVVEAKEVAIRLLKDIVPDELLAAYTGLLVQGGCVQGDAADLLGGVEQVEALIDAGMAHVQSSGPALPPRLTPVPPDLALQGTLADLTRRLVADQERLLAGQRRMAETHPWAGPTVDESSDRLVRIITDREEIGNVSRALITAARHDWMTMDNQSVERPMDELTAVPPPPSFEGHVRCRALYETSCAEHPVGVRTIEIAVEAGEEARLLPKIGMKMKLADEAIAMLPLTPTGMLEGCSLGVALFCGEESGLWFGGEVSSDEAFEFGADAFDGVLAGGGQVEGQGDVFGADAVRMVGQNAQDVVVGGWERRLGRSRRVIVVGQLQQGLVRDLQPGQQLLGVGEFGGEPVDLGAGGVAVGGQMAQQRFGDRWARCGVRRAGHAATAAGSPARSSAGVSRQRVVVPVSRRVIRSVPAQ